MARSTRMNISAGIASVSVATILVGLKLWALGETNALSVAASLVPFLILIVPLLVGGADVSLSFLEKLDQSLTPLRLVLSALLGVLPGLLFGYRAITQSQQAAWYQNLDALFDQPGRLRSRIGRVLGWIAIYVCAAWILFILVALLLG